MRNAPDCSLAVRIERRRRASAVLWAWACVSAILLCGSLAAGVPAPGSQEQSNPYTTWTITILLPPRLMAGHPATLAVLGVDGKLAAGKTVTLGDGQILTTDRTGRAVFTVPASGEYLLAKGSGASVVALIDPAVGASEPKDTTLPPLISTRDVFWICSPGLRGDADANSVSINDEPTVVLAASPECLVALPSAKAAPGPATVIVGGPGTQATVHTTLVALDFDAPQPALLPERKSRLNLSVRGSDQRLGIVAENETPGVLRFRRGDSQELQTTGGPRNVATLEVQAIRPGDYSFRARLLPAPDLNVAQRYLQAAEALAPSDVKDDVKGFVRRLAKRPQDAQAVRTAVGKMLMQTISGDFRTLLNAAWQAL